MKTWAYLLVIAVLFSGCGGSSANNDASEATDTSTRECRDSKELTFVKDSLFYQQWAINYDEGFYGSNAIVQKANINTERDHLKYRGNCVNVAVIDLNLDTTHKDLENAVIGTYNAITGEADVEPSDVETQHHGTAVTGLIGARANEIGTLGVASASNLIFINIQESVTDSMLIDAFEQAVQMGADVINCSWGTGDVSPAVKDKIQSIINNGKNGKGIPIIFAAGNNGTDMGNDESAIPEVITVGSTDETNLRPTYSNHGETLDLMAPGGLTTGITTLDVSGTLGATASDYILYNDLNHFRGTSASAPIVTGLVAVMLGINPELSNDEIIYILRDEASKIGFTQYENGFNRYYGYGKIDFHNTIYSTLRTVGQ